MNKRVFIALGSNCNAEESLKRGLLLLRSKVKIIAASTFYQSRAVGSCIEGADFINGIVEVVTALGPYELKYKVLREIEAALGRKRELSSCNSKIIDLDLLLYGAQVVSTARIKLPDPDIPHFPFISIPLLELAPELVLPGTGKRLDSLVNIEESQTALKRLESYSRQVKDIISGLPPGNK